MNWKVILGIIISALFLFFAFRSVDTQELSIAFKSADYRFVIPAAALSFSAVYHLCTFLPVVVMGFIFLFIEGFSLVELRKSAGRSISDRERG